MPPGAGRPPVTRQLPERRRRWVMTALVTTRIRESATRLGLTHLTDTVDELLARAEAEQARLPRLPRPAPRGRTRPTGRPPVPQRAETLRPAAPQDTGRVRLRLPTRPRRPQGPRPRLPLLHRRQIQHRAPRPTRRRKNDARRRPRRRRLPSRLLHLLHHPRRPGPPAPRRRGHRPLRPPTHRVPPTGAAGLRRSGLPTAGPVS